MSVLYLITHRILGWIDADIEGNEDEKVKVPVTRVLVRGPNDFIIADVVAFDGDISRPEDQTSLAEKGNHYSSWSEVVQYYNADDFDVNDYVSSDCDCPECS